MFFTSSVLFFICGLCNTNFLGSHKHDVWENVRKQGRFTWKTSYSNVNILLHFVHLLCCVKLFQLHYITPGNNKIIYPSLVGILFKFKELQNILYLSINKSSPKNGLRFIAKSWSFKGQMKMLLTKKKQQKQQSKCSAKIWIAIFRKSRCQMVHPVSFFDDSTISFWY